MKKHLASILLSLGILLLIFVIPNPARVSAWHAENWSAEDITFPDDVKFFVVADLRPDISGDEIYAITGDRNVTMTYYDNQEWVTEVILCNDTATYELPPPFSSNVSLAFTPAPFCLTVGDPYPDHSGIELVVGSWSVIQGTWEVTYGPFYVMWWNDTTDSWEYKCGYLGLTWQYKGYLDCGWLDPTYDFELIIKKYTHENMITSDFGEYREAVVAYFYNETSEGWDYHSTIYEWYENGEPKSYWESGRFIHTVCHDVDSSHDTATGQEELVLIPPHMNHVIRCYHYDNGTCTWACETIASLKQYIPPPEDAWQIIGRFKTMKIADANPDAQLGKPYPDACLSDSEVYAVADYFEGAGRNDSIIQLWKTETGWKNQTSVL